MDKEIFEGLCREISKKGCEFELEDFDISMDNVEREFEFNYNDNILFLSVYANLIETSEERYEVERYDFDFDFFDEDENLLKLSLYQEKQLGKLLDKETVLI